MPIATNGLVMLIDSSICIACRACQVACQQWNKLTDEDTEFTGTYKNPQDMSGTNLTVVKFQEVEKTTPPVRTDFLFFLDRCRHCNTPFCMGACPLGAIKKTWNGMVWIDQDLCIPEGEGACYAGDPSSLRPCQNACPYNIPKWRYVKDGVEQGDLMRKCHFCRDRIYNAALPAASRRPACQVACPTGAITLGPWNVQRGRAIIRMNYLRSAGYSGATIYSGRPISGGTHVAWILKYPRSWYQDGTIDF